MSRTVLVTGGAGFIGSALVRHLIHCTDCRVVNVDALTYAGRLESLHEVAESPRYRFEHVDIQDTSALLRVFQDYSPAAVFHLAAESHVDRSIDGPLDFVRTNVVGTASLLAEARRYWSQLHEKEKRDFRILHVSTDEVYGSLGSTGHFTECSSYDPNSPYSASKAAADHFARVWHRVYGLPVLLTNCSNNFGPFQFPEKLIPHMILCALEGRELPVYGDGKNVRDWLYVEDHVRALLAVLEQGRVGETYIVGGDAERQNIQIVHAVCDLLDEFRPRGDGLSYRSQITYVEDRRAHDRRYAIDATKIHAELDWRPVESFESALRRTVQWYLESQWWWEPIRAGTCGGERLGVVA